ncbi:MAG: arginine--tRNA ligase [Kiritimatiellia bacterium]|jgi:arginyl-tRNA synthetase|nr:arginine--tRNA ligase [Kiritimatiellia bacterium]MDP6629928.1 arginine--tRNA ligase [Kiritimatiellia bacterium]MDP6810126.1 arginine--tRNA ligase [Kiritimatiellia bacterium]MDP7023656.1 arginine--tRNA ligase [Kiritimatiellia bacterium]
MTATEATSIESPAEILSGWIRDAFRGCFPDADTDFTDIAVVDTANPEFGDYQCNAAMGLAKVLRQAPRAIAETVAKAPDQPDCLDRLEVAGPGFLNLYLDSDWLARHVERMAADAQLGVPQVGAGKTVVMDYGSPNMTKPLHIGHLRSHNIGSVLDRMHRFLGYSVIADNHLGDWGTQFGITIMGYRHFGDEQAMQTSPLEELERVYVLSYEKTRQDEEWLEQCRRELVKLQSGDEENLELWEMFMRLSLEELDRMYARLGVHYDIVHGESYYRDKLAGTVERLEQAGLAVESEGATVVMLEEEKLPVCIVRKSDGGFNYATSDLATVAARVEEFNPDRIIYVTDERQQLHFKQIFAICRRLEYTVGLDHIWFGLMRLPEATFSTREGNVIKLEALLAEAESRALEIIAASSPDMPEAERRTVASVVGVGAVKYADLSQNPQSLVTFTWDKALALDGNSGPYLQYAYARIASVRGKYAERFPEGTPEDEPLRLEEAIERTLALQLIRFRDVVARAAHQYKPNVLTDYLYDLAQTYSSFYQNVPFLKAPEGIRESRVRLCTIVATVLKQGLDLLGLKTLERI